MDNKELSRAYTLALLLLVFAAVAPAQVIDDFLGSALSDTTFDWSFSEAEGIRIYYQKRSFAEKHRATLLRSVITAKSEVLEFVGGSAYDRTTNVCYLGSREEMERIVGRPYSGFANWTASAVFVVLNPQWRSFEKHEITHLLTMGVWGAPQTTSRWMIEGIAVRCDGWCREYSVDEIAFYFLSRDELPPLGTLFGDFSALGEIRGGFYAASVIGFIRQKYGPEAVRNVWNNGSADLEESLGENVSKVESAWKEYLRLKVGEAGQIDLETINKLGCG